jgi:hypothetical protein
MTPLALGGHNLTHIDAPVDPAKRYLGPRIAAWRCFNCDLELPNDGTPWPPWPHPPCPGADDRWATRNADRWARE